MIDLRRPIEELADEVRQGKVSAEDLVQASFEAIKAKDEYHAVLETSEVAIVRAREIDAAIKNGEDPGRLAGIPFIAKDNFLTRNTHTTAASNILKPFESPYQSTAVNRLEAEGAVMEVLYRFWLGGAMNAYLS